MIKKIIRLFFLIILIIAFLFSGYKLYKYVKEYSKVKKEMTNISTVLDNDNFFERLKGMNNDVVSYIKVEGTNIDYPIVQTNENDFYLNHSFDKNYSQYGWIFMDYRNNLFEDQNTIIYGHAMLNKTMFGSIKDMFKSSWLDNYNHEIKVYEDESFVTYKIYSMYKTPAVNDYLKTSFTDSEYNEFLESIKRKSIYDFKVDASKGSKMITLSTCSGQNKRLVVHAIRV